VEQEVPAPKPTGAGDEEAAAAAAAMQKAPGVEVPVKETPGMVAPERFEDPGEVPSSAAFGAVGPFADVATTSECGLEAGPSEWPSDGVRWAIIRPRVPEEIVCVEREEDEI